MTQTQPRPLLTPEQRSQLADRYDELRAVVARYKRAPYHKHTHECQVCGGVVWHEQDPDDGHWTTDGCIDCAELKADELQHLVECQECGERLDPRGVCLNCVDALESGEFTETGERVRHLNEDGGSDR